MGLVCMAPGWKSDTGDWTSHEVYEVWLAVMADGGEFLRLLDVDGLPMEVGLPSDSYPGEIERTRLFKLLPRWRPAQPKARKPGGQKRKL